MRRNVHERELVAVLVVLVLANKVHPGRYGDRPDDPKFGRFTVV